MPAPRLMVTTLLAALFLRAFAQAAATLDPKALANAVRDDAVSIPTPGELFAAVGKAGKPSWPELYRKPAPTSFTSRVQMALALGALIADGFIAVEAQDGQQVKNVGKDIVALAKSLGVSENVVSRGKSISDFAESNDWNTLKEEIEATQNEVKLTMVEQKDDDLVTLVTLGAWVRGCEAISTWIAANYSPEMAALVRQPAIVDFLRGKLAAISKRERENDRDRELVKLLSRQLAEIQKLVAFPPDAPPPPENINALRTLAAELVAEFTSTKK